MRRQAEVLLFVLTLQLLHSQTAHLYLQGWRHHVSYPRSSMRTSHSSNRIFRIDIP